MITNTTYELRFKTMGYPWKVFDTYKSKDDPQLVIYHNLLAKTKFNGGVKVVEIKTTRATIDLTNKE